jgi:hypothetical protein
MLTKKRLALKIVRSLWLKTRGGGKSRGFSLRDQDIPFGPVYFSQDEVFYECRSP